MLNYSFDGEKLMLKTYSEVYFINLGRALFFQADDHYSYVFYSDKEKYMLPFGLSTIEDALTSLENNNRFVRMGRKYIVNVGKVFKVNVFKQQLFMEGKENNIVLNIPKPVLSQFLEQL